MAWCVTRLLTYCASTLVPIDSVHSRPTETVVFHGLKPFRMGSFDCYFQGNSVALQSSLDGTLSSEYLRRFRWWEKHEKPLQDYSCRARFDDLHGCRSEDLVRSDMHRR